MLFKYALPKFSNHTIVVNSLIAASTFTFIAIILGVVIRVTGSAAACPDLITCLEGWPFDATQKIVVPFLHRIFTLLSGFFILVSAFVAWKWSSNRHIVKLLIIAIFLFIFQVLLGLYLGFQISGADSTLLIGFVASENLRLLSAFHLTLSLTIMTLLLVATVFITSVHQTGFPIHWMKQTSSYTWISMATLIAVSLLIISGIVVSTFGISNSCRGWPLCEGLNLPLDLDGWVNLFHRFVTGLSVVLMAVLVVRAWFFHQNQKVIIVTSTAAGTLLLMQIFMGIFEFYREFPPYLQGLHIATAISIFSLLVILTVSSRFVSHNNGLSRSEYQHGHNRQGLLRDFLMLTKPVVVSLLLVTTYAGMVLGGKNLPSFDVLFWTLLAGAMAAGGSGAINQYIDRFDDERMQRTSRRPIPSGRLTPGEGLAFGVALCLASFYIMVAFVNLLAAFLTLAGMFYYVVLYSMILKKTTVQNIVIGGGAGAIPPLVGWAAVTGSLNVPSIFLFAVIFLWTPPHFWALALVRRKDYARAGVPMLPVVRGEAETRWQIFLYTLYLVGLTLLLPFFGLGGGLYFILALVLGGGLIFSAWKVWKESGNKVAWRMYRHSSMYLAFLFAALVLDVLI